MRCTSTKLMFNHRVTVVNLLAGREPTASQTQYGLVLRSDKCSIVYLHTTSGECTRIAPVNVPPAITPGREWEARQIGSTCILLCINLLHTKFPVYYLFIHSITFCSGQRLTDTV